MERLHEMAFETPAFATYKGGEIDFFVKSLIGGEKKYGIEVKSGKNQATTGQRALEDKKIDVLLLLKRNTMGGVVENTYTIPVYLFHRFQFDL